MKPFLLKEDIVKLFDLESVVNIDGEAYMVYRYKAEYEAAYMREGADTRLVVSNDHYTWSDSKFTEMENRLWYSIK